MKRHVTLGSALAVALLLGGAVVAADLESGPQVGSRRLPAFSPLNVNGPQAGSKACQV
jgi:hypothetical protein